MNRHVLIDEVSIDESSRLHITPQLQPAQDYSYIWRAAMSVRWSQDTRSLYAIASDLNGVESYSQILRAVAEEYGHRLVLSEHTVWSDVPESTKSKIEALTSDAD